MTSQMDGIPEYPHGEERICSDSSFNRICEKKRPIRKRVLTVGKKQDKAGAFTKAENNNLCRQAQQALPFLIELIVDLARIMHPETYFPTDKHIRVEKESQPRATTQQHNNNDAGDALHNSHRHTQNPFPFFGWTTTTTTTTTRSIHTQSQDHAVSL